MWNLILRWSWLYFVSKDIFCFHFVINAIILNANFGYWFIVYDSNPYNVFKSIYCFWKSSASKGFHNSSSKRYNNIKHTFVGSFLIRYLFFPSSSFRSFRENEKDNLGISNRKIIFGPLHTYKIGRLFNSIYHSIPWSAIICTRDRVDKMAAKSWHSERGRY